ncbi:efflux RND transporter periplasmic adaptor subunit [Methylomonas albis]|uniref:Membrane fusion protein biotin-lipoyl like domain-containing protein n=1 Tax=Methylomonas albis TaxID=1854563 RepID=A0ABR9CZ61_9GAMM|nr:biotin/lipoyl-binding protein [Methylomonas albis]MBD9355821.1 hypothetical protein [Methylomonas albis]
MRIVEGFVIGLPALLLSLSITTWADEAVQVRTAPLSQLAIYPESAAPAVVVSLNHSAIASQIDALVVDLPVRVGDSVKVGAVLVQLACRDFELERSRLQGERLATQAKLELAQWQLQQAETLARQQTLPEEQVQEKRSQLAVLRGDLAAHGARIETTERPTASFACFRLPVNSNVIRAIYDINRPFRNQHRRSEIGPDCVKTPNLI